MINIFNHVQLFSPIPGKNATKIIEILKTRQN